MSDWLRDLRENWSDHYWRADHPEVTAVIIAIATGLLGLLFAYMQALITKNVATRET